LSRARILQLLLIATFTVAVRLPFLLHGDRFFDSDEAVEGLMARHVLHGELSAYLWGQHYKGVPEVYLASLFFAVAGPTVIALKAATLTPFVAFVCLQFLLVVRLFSTRVAWMTTAFAVLGPPSLVLWTLSANAEIVMTLLAGAVMGLELERWRRTGSLTAVATTSAALGFGLWVQQYIVYYLVAYTVTWVIALPARDARLREFIAARELPARARLVLHAVLAVALGYVALGIIAFLSGSFELTVSGLTIGLRNPQKLWRIAVGIVALCGGGRVAGRLLTRSGRPNRPLAAAALVGFAIGYAPALAGQIQAPGAAPIAWMDLVGLRAAIGPIAKDVVPIVLGFRSPTTERVPVSGWFSLVIVLTIVVSYMSLRSSQEPQAQRVTPFFHVFLVVTPLLFFASGAFIDAQSYRYLMPIYAALPVVLAVGVDALMCWKAAAGAAALSVLIGIFAAEQTAWYRQLARDTDSPAILTCLEANQVRGAWADYWLSYKLTFLAEERIIVAPVNGVDRYPPFTAFVRAQNPIATDCLSKRGQEPLP